MHQKPSISSKSLAAAANAYRLEMQKMQNSGLDMRAKENFVFKALARQFSDVDFADKRFWLQAIRKELGKEKALRKLSGNPYAEKASGEEREDTEKEFPLAEKETEENLTENISRTEEQPELFEEGALKPLSKKEHLRNAKPVFKMR